VKQHVVTHGKINGQSRAPGFEMNNDAATETAFLPQSFRAFRIEITNKTKQQQRTNSKEMGFHRVPAI
jgi:hypothetical protein